MISTDTAARFSRRRMWNRLVRWRLPIAGVVGAALAVFGGWVMFSSSWLAAETVTVSGESRLSPRAIEAVADVPLGTPLVRVDLDAIHDRVAAIPDVASVAVHRSWPHSIAIDVTERTAIATVRRDAQWWDVDEDGAVFNGSARRDHDLPVVAIPRAAGRDAMVGAASVIAALPDTLLAQTKRLTAASMDSITLHLNNHREVVWGSSSESDRKVEVLAALLVKVHADGYDVSVPEQPTTTGAGGQ
jgi:cell division protein FtsQ